MTDVPPAPSAPSATPASAGSPVPAGPSSQAQAASLPSELARSPAGTTVEGEVRTAASDGRVTVRTNQGEVRLELARTQLAQLLRPGTQVTLELRNPTAQPPIVLLTVRGSPAQAPAAQPPPAVQVPATPGAPAPLPGTPAPAGPARQPLPGQTSNSASTSSPHPPAVSTGSVAPQPTVPLTVGRIVQAVVVPGPSAAGTPVPTTSASAPAPTLAATQPQSSPATPATSPAAPPTTVPPAGTPPPPGSIAPGTAAAAGQPAATPAPAGAASPAPGQPATPPAASPTPANPSPSGTAAPVTPAAQSRLPTGAVLTVRIAAVDAPTPRSEGVARAITGLEDRNAGNAAPARIAGQIAGVTAAGRPVVQSPVGFLALDARADLRLGTPIDLDVLASRTATAPERSAPLPVLAREWPALDAVMRALEELAGPAAAQQMTEGVPRPGPQMTAALLFFMAALRGGDARKWLGRSAVQALENAGQGRLLDALSDDFQTLQRAAEPSEGGWRSFLIPVAWDERRPIRLLTRRDQRGGGGKGAQPGTAFLVDLDLTNLGPFRLDGLIRGDLLDLMVRTTTPLPAIMRQDIKALFDGTLDRTGIVGRLTFRAVPVMPPLPIAGLEAGAAGDTTSVTI